MTPLQRLAIEYPTDATDPKSQAYTNREVIELDSRIGLVGIVVLTVDT